MCIALKGLNLILGTYYCDCMADSLLPLLQYSMCFLTLFILNFVMNKIRCSWQVYLQ